MFILSIKYTHLYFNFFVQKQDMANALSFTTILSVSHFYLEYLEYKDICDGLEDTCLIIHNNSLNKTLIWECEFVSNPSYMGEAELVIYHTFLSKLIKEYIKKHIKVNVVFRDEPFNDDYGYLQFPRFARGSFQQSHQKPMSNTVFRI